MGRLHPQELPALVAVETAAAGELFVVCGNRRWFAAPPDDWGMGGRSHKMLGFQGFLKVGKPRGSDDFRWFQGVLGMDFHVLGSISVNLTMLRQDHIQVLSRLKKQGLETTTMEIEGIWRDLAFWPPEMDIWSDNIIAATSRCFPLGESSHHPQDRPSALGETCENLAHLHLNQSTNHGAAHAPVHWS